MAEMVSAQPEMVAPILGGPAAVDIARLVTEAVGRGEPVVIAGCGTSEHGAPAIARLLDAGLRQRGLRGGLVEARQALEAALDPSPGGLFVAVSHDGGTRATLLAAEAARHAGARVALVTANAQGQIAAYANAVVVTPLRDRSWCQTVAYSSVILAGGAVAALAEAGSIPGRCGPPSRRRSSRTGGAVPSPPDSGANVRSSPAARGSTRRAPTSWR